MRPSLRVSAALLVLTAAANALAQSELFDLVPDGALGLVVVNRLAETSKKVESVGQQLQVPMPPPLGTVKSVTGLQKGIDESKAAGLIILPAVDTERPVAAVLLVPVKDYQVFVAQLRPADPTARIAEVQVAGAQALVASKGNYAAFALVEQKPVLESFLDSKASANQSLQPLAKWTSAQDIYAAALPAGVREGTTKGLEALDRVLKNLEEAGEQQKAIGAMFEPYRDLLRRAQADVTHFGEGFRIDKTSALHLSSVTLLAQGSSMGRAFGDVKRVDGIFHGLPNDPYAVVGGVSIPETWLNKFSDLVAKFSRLNPGFGNLDEKQAKEIAEASVASLRGAKSMAIFAGVTKPDEPAYAHTVAVMQTDDAERYLAQYEKALARVQVISKKAGAAVPQYATKHLKVDDVDILEIEMDMSAMLAAQPHNEMAKSMMEKFMGPGGKVKVYAAVADKSTVIFAYISEENLKRALAAAKSPESGLKGNEGIRSTMKLLPRGSQWVAFVSPRDSFNWFRSIFGGLIPPGRFKELPDFPATPPIGMAMRFSRDRLDTDVAIPGDITTATGKYIQAMQHARQAEAEESE